MKSTWGSVRKNSKGMWEIRYPYTDPITGKKTRKSKYAKTRKEAEKIRAELRVKYEDKETVVDDLTFRQLWEHFYYPSTENLVQRTREGYKSTYLNHIEPVFGDRVIATTKKRDVQEHLLSLSYGQARNVRAVLSQMYNFADDEEDLIENNIMTKKYKLPEKSKRILKQNKNIYPSETLELLLEEFRGEDFEAAYIMAAGGGLRRGEAFGPKREEITFTHHEKADGVELFAIVPIKRSVQILKNEDTKKGEVSVLEKGKTEESIAAIVISEPFSIRLKEIVDSSDDIWLSDDGFGYPMNPVNTTKQYARWFNSRPYSCIPFRNLRNSYATMMAARGVDELMIKKMLRHTANSDVAYKHYIRPGVEELITVISDSKGY